MSRKKAKAVHFSSIHPTFDNRVFEKELRTLADAGYEMVFVVPAERSAIVEGVRIHALPVPRGRLDRFVGGGYRALRSALAERGDLYHFHDPDLIPWAALLRLLTGKPVVYDVHESYATAIASRQYMPAWLAVALGRLYGRLEGLSQHLFSMVIAEREYARWLPRATPVLNYPDLSHFTALEVIERDPPERVRVLYTGNLAEIRGALIYPKVLDQLPLSAEIHVVGRLASTTAAEMRRTCADPTRLHLEGVGEGLGEHVPYARILAAYREPWTAATALFRNDLSHSYKDLTKFFEYMAAGLPIICSDFSAWRALIAGNGVGICVDPEDPAAITAAILELHQRPALARSMGERGRRLVRERFNWSTQAENLLALYARLLGSRSTARPLTAR